jgi:serine/threonine protein phosphatase PrpC
VDIEQIQLESGDYLLLCTNGLTDAVREDEIADALAVRRSPKEDCRQLVDLAVSNGRYQICLMAGLSMLGVVRFGQTTQAMTS